MENNKGSKPKKTPSIPPRQEEQDDCPYNENMAAFSSHYRKEDLAQWREIPRDYIIKLWKKGYHWEDILQLWGWKIPEVDIPDLKAEKRIGVINGLYVVNFHPRIFDESLSEDEKKKMTEEGLIGGELKNLVVIVRKSSGEPKINIDKRVIDTIPLSRKWTTKGYMEEVVNFACSQENINPSQWEISILSSIGAERFGGKENEVGGGEMGKSTGSTIYLALLSALHQKPISKQIAATGALAMKETKRIFDAQEINLPKGTNLPIGGLRKKVFAAAEKGVNRLVLSKYNTSPNILAKKFKHSPSWRKIFDDYQTIVPSAIREKMTTYFAKNVKEMRELFLEGKLS